MNNTLNTILFSTLALSTGCAASPSPDQDVTSVRMALEANTLPGSVAPGAIAGEDAQGTIFTLSHAVAYVRHIRLDLPSDESCTDLDFKFLAPVTCEGSKIEITGPFVVDLIDGTSTPSLTAVHIPRKAYRRVDVRFDDAEPKEGLVDTADTLAKHTMHAMGTFDDGTRAAPFDLLLKFNEDARFESSNGVDLDGSSGQQTWLMLDVSHWFEALPITECLDDGDIEIVDGALLIRDGDSTCSDIESALKKAIKNSGQLKGA